MTRSTGLIFALVAVAMAALAGTRLSFNVDLLDLLPQDLREVRGLREFTERFSEEGELVVTVSAPGAEPEQVAEWAGQLADRLSREQGLAERVEWRPIWEEDPQAAAELPAYLWLNGDSGQLGELAERLSPGESERTLADALEELQFGFDGEALAFAAYDPFGLLRPPGAGPGLGGDAGGRFSSADGSFRAIYLVPPARVDGYKPAAAWVEEVRAIVESFRQDTGLPGSVSFGYTGEPAFEAEIGSGMERDMTGSVVGAMALIHLIFFLMHRRLLPLVAMFLTLSLVLSLTVVIGSFWIGELSVMSVGFAAILVGLTVDYGVVLYQESRAGARGVGQLRSAVGPGIIWAAVTTAAVFASLVLSALPGIRELGLLVGAGVLLGAALMLLVFAPMASGLGSAHPLPADGASRRVGDRGRLIITGSLALGALVLLAARGLPGFYASFDALRPSESAADDAYREMAKNLVDSEGDALPMVVVADDLETLAERAAGAARVAGSLVESGHLRASAFLPELIPSQGRQRANRETITAIVSQEGRLSRELGEEFSDEAIAVASSVFSAWRGMLEAGAPVMRPVGAEARRTLRQAVHEGGDGVASMGLLRLMPGSWDVVRAAFADLEGVYITGWPTLGPAVRPLVLADVRGVFTPMAVVLLVMLAIVFRRPAEIGLAVAVLVLSGIVLLAVMRFAGWEWDFLNVCAFPLLLGTGIDYTVHMIGALRRSGGCPLAIRRGIGRALLFCGVSTAIGFGSLALADNDGLASLGRVCACGTLITMTVAVFLLPAWWRRLANKG